MVGSSGLGIGHRARILSFVGLYPGSYLSQIERGLSIGTGVAQYHLYTLEKNRQIVSRRFGRLRRYFAASALAEQDQAILDVLLRETDRDILLHLIDRPGAHQAELSRRLQIAPTSVIWHMNRLRTTGLIEARRSGRFVTYALKVEPAVVLGLLRAHRPTLVRKLVDRLENLLETMSDL